VSRVLAEIERLAALESAKFEVRSSK